MPERHDVAAASAEVSAQDVGFFKFYEEAAEKAKAHAWSQRVFEKFSR
jgi:hypothetical protein